jgi:hypothetical protein
VKLKRTHHRITPPLDKFKCEEHTSPELL